MPRKPISEGQKRALRRWYQTAKPRRQADGIAWFQAQFQQRITTSTISEILSNRYGYLDNEDPRGNHPRDVFRQRAPNWPILEAILYDWQQGIADANGNVTGDMIIEKAHEVWPRIPEYAHLERPEFSSGWLDGFKKRHGIRKYTYKPRGSRANDLAAANAANANANDPAAATAPAAPVIPATTTVTSEIGDLRFLVHRYRPKDIFTMDETGLFWRQTPSSPATKTKKEKDRLTLALCANASGSERLPPWIIGKSETPKALQSVNLKALGAAWRHNGMAWMTTEIMVEWLQDFYAYIGSERTVILLLDNFAAHVSAVDAAAPPPNIQIQWLPPPPNPTSTFQPFDHGIVNHFKAVYRKKWLHLLIEKYETQVNPLQVFTLYHAVRWILHIWRYETGRAAIFNSFIKSTLISGSEMQPPPDPTTGLSMLYENARRAGQIREVMSLDAFLNSPEENEIGAPDLDRIVASHVADSSQPDDDEPMPLPPPSLRAALDAVRTILHYQEYSPDSKPEEMRMMERLERSLGVEMQKTMQSSLDRYIT